MTYWIYEYGRSNGPFSAAEIEVLAGPNTLVNHGQEWLPLAEHPDFRRNFNKLSAAGPRTPPQTTAATKKDSLLEFFLFKFAPVVATLGMLLLISLVYYGYRLDHIESQIAELSFTTSGDGQTEENGLADEEERRIRARIKELLTGIQPAQGSANTMDESWQTSNAVNADLPTRQEFLVWVIGLTPDQVISEIGRPDYTENVGNRGIVVFAYSNVCIDPYTNKADERTHLIFEPTSSGKIVACKIH